MSKFNYPIIVRPLSSEEGGGYLAEFPDLPGCIADGETIEEAISEAGDALKAWLKVAEERNHPIPIPSISENFSGQTRLRMPKSLHAQLSLHAKQEGVSLNSLVNAMLERELGREEARAAIMRAKNAEART